MPRHALTAREADIVAQVPEVGWDEETLREAEAMRRRLDGEFGLDISDPERKRPMVVPFVIAAAVIICAVAIVWWLS